MPNLASAKAIPNRISLMGRQNCLLGLCDGRRHYPPRARPEALPARLRRDRLSGEILEDRSTCLCPDRGHYQGPRYIRFVVPSIETGSAEHIYEPSIAPAARPRTSSNYMVGVARWDPGKGLVVIYPTLKVTVS
jgi:hypothetical protein